MDIEKKTKRLTNTFVIIYVILLVAAIAYLIYSFVHASAADQGITTKHDWVADKLTNEEKLALVVKSIIMIVITIPIFLILKFKKKQTRKIIAKYLRKFEEQLSSLENMDENYDLDKKIKKYKKIKSSVMELNRICGDEIILINSYLAEEIENTTMDIEMLTNRKIASDEISRKSSDYKIINKKVSYLIENYKMLFTGEKLEETKIKKQKNSQI